MNILSTFKRGFEPRSAVIGSAVYCEGDAFLDHSTTEEPGKRLKAVGVELRGPEGESWLVHSSRDTVLSAGAVNTPQILMLSGVGPAAHLRRLGIPVVVDLPVGENLHDHLNMPLYVTLELPVSVTTDKVLTFRQLRKFFLSGEGLLASSAVMGVGSAHRNISLVLFGMGSPDEKVMRDIANMKPQTFSGLFHFNGSNETSKEGFVMLASCLQPLSRGTVSLASRHPFTPPMIDPRYLQQPQDVACLVEAAQVAARVVSSPPFQRLGARLRLPRLEECEDLIPDPHDSGFLECVVRTVAITGYHPGGTCRMGRPRDATTVLDPQLRLGHPRDATTVLDPQLRSVDKV
ncbi:unnamed protein product [Timema podura]|uniref:Glucose-methanol-choline oxidoreductase N-terminal domain-containing protein n=1 Tax=Timema podura TaxID=61482 RepID=A0ABN7NWX9_TIMPD|nr:unnamed protein product [Timema podura]